MMKTEIDRCQFLITSVVILSIPYLIVFLSLSRVLGIIVFLIILLYSICLILLKLKFYIVGRVGFILSGSFAVTFFSLVFEKTLNIHMFYIFFMCLPCIIFNHNEKKYIFLSSSIPMVSFLITSIFKFNSFPTIAISELLRTVLSISIYITIAICIYLLIIYYSFETQRKEIKIRKTNQSLKEAYDELKESKKREHEAHDQALFGKVIRGVGHEIKNPLAGLKLWSDMLSKSLDNPEIVKKASQVFENNINRLTQRTAIMLKYTGNQKYSLQVFNLNTILNDLVLLFEHNFKQYDINFEFKDIPQIEVYGSEDLLQSALRNVMLNALQFTPKKGTITLSAKYSNYRDPDETIRHGVGIAISDTGPGIPQDQLTEIFKPFITSHAQSENAGLGLAEVNKAMMYMYGGVEVVSEAGKGTTFYLYVPLEEPVCNGKSLIRPISEDKE